MGGETAYARRAGGVRGCSCWKMSWCSNGKRMERAGCLGREEKEGKVGGGRGGAEGAGGPRADGARAEK